MINGTKHVEYQSWLILITAYVPVVLLLCVGSRYHAPGLCWQMSVDYCGHVNRMKTIAP